MRRRWRKKEKKKTLHAVMAKCICCMEEEGEKEGGMEGECHGGKEKEGREIKRKRVKEERTTVVKVES